MMEIDNLVDLILEGFEDWHEEFISNQIREEKENIDYVEYGYLKVHYARTIDRENICYIKFGETYSRSSAQREKDYYVLNPMVSSDSFNRIRGKENILKDSKSFNKTARRLLDQNPHFQVVEGRREWYYTVEHDGEDLINDFYNAVRGRMRMMGTYYSYCTMRHREDIIYILSALAGVDILEELEDEETKEKLTSFIRDNLI